MFRMREQFFRGFIFLLVVVLMTSDMTGQLISDLGSTTLGGGSWNSPSNHLGKVKGGGGGGEPSGPPRESVVQDSMIITAEDKLQVNSNQISMNEDEKQKLLNIKAHLTSVMQQYCLPFVICELHASAGDRDNLSEAERGIINIIRETSLGGSMGEALSRYHFAAHMGQLLSGVEGNGCQNLYPSCPLNKIQVLEMVKKVRVR